MRTTFKAGADLTGKIGYAVKASTNDREVVLGATAGELCVGILINDNIAGYAVGVALGGEICKGKLGGTVACGDGLAVDANGKLVVASAGDIVVAKALKAGVANDLVEVEVVDYVEPAST